MLGKAAKGTLLTAAIADNIATNTTSLASSFFASYLTKNGAIDTAISNMLSRRYCSCSQKLEIANTAQNKIIPTISSFFEFRIVLSHPYK